MIFRELSNAVFRFVLRCTGAEIDGGGGVFKHPPSGGGKSRGPSGRGCDVSSGVNGNGKVRCPRCCNVQLVVLLWRRPNYCLEVSPRYTYLPRTPAAGSRGASVVRGISQSCAGETFGYAAQGRSQRPQTCSVDAPWYGTRAMQVTTPRGQNCARRAQFCIAALCPLAPTPFEEISRNLI